MTVRTKQIFETSPDKLWPLLFNSKMDDKQPCYLLCGLPKPVECRLPGDAGGVGSTRECISDKGIIRQEITEWNPGHKLAFELRETDLYFGSCVQSIKEEFELKEINAERTELSRKTTFVVRSSWQLFVSIPMFIGLKAIHRYVFDNWHRLASLN